MTTAEEWVTSFARALGVAEPTDEEAADVLRLAGVAAHASERRAAPLACWLAARAGVPPDQAARLAATVAQEEAGDQD